MGTRNISIFPSIVFFPILPLAFSSVFHIFGPNLILHPPYMEFPKQYAPKNFEKTLAAKWELSGKFQPKESTTGKTFYIPIPPPNVTGYLHLGHALTLTLEDIMVRYHRMKGDSTLWVPGTDHAGIATQARVEKMLAES